MNTFDPCPLCGEAVVNIGFTFSEPATHDLGWMELIPGMRPARITICDAPKVLSIIPEPCGCALVATEWTYLDMPGEPIRWMHPDELDRFINEL